MLAIALILFADCRMPWFHNRYGLDYRDAMHEFVPAVRAKFGVPGGYQGWECRKCGCFQCTPDRRDN